MKIRMRFGVTAFACALVVPLIWVLIAMPAGASTTPGAFSFTLTSLLRPDGASEPAVTVGGNGTVVVSALDGPVLDDFFTDIWKGPFGAAPAYQGPIDASVGRGVGGTQTLGGADADVDLGSTGTLHATTLLFQFNPASAFVHNLAVSAIRCPNAVAAGDLANCSSQLLDTTKNDRPFVTSDGQHVYVSYTADGSSTHIRVQRSDDDGRTWRLAGDAITGLGKVTANSTFDSRSGPIVTDQQTHDVYVVFAAGEGGLQKAKNYDLNKIYVSRSTSLGIHWRTSLVYAAPTGTRLWNIFPALAIDPVTEKLYAAWSDGRTVSMSASSDHGATWTAAVPVSIAPANTAIFPWLAAYGGTVDLVYYAADSASKDDPSAVWHVYMAQTTDDGAHISQGLVQAAPNHIGPICMEGFSCPPAERTLLDLFEVAINPVNGMAAVAYADDTITTDASGAPRPQTILAQQSP
jgi:hypothetical protein